MPKKENHLTTSDLQAIADLLDKQTAVLATKEELREGLANQTVELKAYIHEGIETVMDGVGSRVDKVEKDVKELKLSHGRH